MASHGTDTTGAPLDGARPQRRLGGEWLANVAQRFATAFILMPVVIAMTFGGGWWTFAGALVCGALALWELRNLLAERGWHPIIPLCAALMLVFLVAAMLPGQRLVLLALAISGAIVLPFVWLMLTRTSLEGALGDWALTLALPLYLGWPMAFFLLLRGGQPGYQSPGFWWTLTMFFTVWAFDTFAFFAGRFFGRTLLAPRISPKKTWEGAAGGLLFALLAAWLFTRPIGIAWYHALALGALVSIAATLGDLAESLLKRTMGASDSGTLMRGHGGILDRLDSLLFAVLVVFFYAAFLGSIKV